MKLGKKIFIYLMVGFLSFSSVSITYYKSVHAFEWVGGAISFVEAMKWLLGALGVLGGIAITHDLWVEYADDFEDWALEAGNTHEQVTEWQSKLCMGVLDKGSSVWTSFKTWVANLIDNSGGVSSEYSFTLPASAHDTTQYIHDNICEYCPISNESWMVRAFGISGASSSTPNITLLYTDRSYYVDNDGTISAIDNSTFSYDRTNQFAIYPNNGFQLSTGSYAVTVFDKSQPYYITDNIDISNSNKTFTFVSVGSSSVGSNDFYTIGDARTEQFDLINRITGNEVEQEVAIPMPGVDASDDSISQDAYDEIIERVNNGDITTDEAVEEVQELLKVIVFDSATDDVIPVAPDPDDPLENEKKDDVIKDNKDNMGFTLAGLENVFPFCIPWDIYAFLNILDADPVAPVFNIPFPNVDDPEHPLTTQVDLSSWDDAMAIVRLAQDFLFIIGLAFLTRSMIGAGGGD